VPGDLYEPGEEVPCDSIVVKGDLFVNEVNLTGENVPIAKFRIIEDSKHDDKCHWLFEGSKIETMKEHTLALAINVGYTSQRGRIIRKILNKTSKQP
jgi:cation-transporting P-type ATPase 13A2